MGATKVEKVIMKYEFGLAAGTTAIAAHKLGVLPAGATITKAWIDIDTTFTSATDAATIALGYTGAAGAFDAAMAISDVSNPWDAAVPRVSVGAADGAVGNYVVIGASPVEVLATVAVEALTAGKGYLYVEYVVNA